MEKIFVIIAQMETIPLAGTQIIFGLVPLPKILKIVQLRVERAEAKERAR